MEGVRISTRRAAEEAAVRLNRAMGQIMKLLEGPAVTSAAETGAMKATKAIMGILANVPEVAEGAAVLPLSSSINLSPISRERAALMAAAVAVAMTTAPPVVSAAAGARVQARAAAPVGLAVAEGLLTA